jgi:hypothetical protein
MTGEAVPWPAVDVVSSSRAENAANPAAPVMPASPPMKSAATRSAAVKTPLGRVVCAAGCGAGAP